MPSLYTTETEHALEAVIRAATLCQQVQREMVSSAAVQKADRSPVTVADYASQAVICRGLADAFPGDPVVAEETAESLRQPDQAPMLAQVTNYVRTCLPGAVPAEICAWIDHGGAEPGPRFWTLDPIDGTKGFLRGEQYAVALALVVNAQVQLGALACPNLPLDLSQPNAARGVVFLAVRDQGAKMYPLDGGPARSIAVSSPTAPQATRFVESFEAGHTNHAGHSSLVHALGITQPSLRLDSQAKYGVVARGDAAIYLRLPSPRTPEYRERIWDHAAGALIVEEAGGRVTDALGTDLDFSRGRQLSQNRGIVVSNGFLHSVILDEIQNRGLT
ncbi:MAG: 3'(2'),5'-bisphosphate nucleotidase [Anaerolineales bacterium]|nr:MAG: 3'(2'),5'-bisphosphate nucleotidase [Anaerolineales bacterium]